MTKRQQIQEYISISKDYLLSGDTSVDTILHNLEQRFDIKFDDEEKINDELERHTAEIGTILYNWLDEQKI